MLELHKPAPPPPPADRRLHLVCR